MSPLNCHARKHLSNTLDISTCMHLLFLPPKEPYKIPHTNLLVSRSVLLRVSESTSKHGCIIYNYIHKCVCMYIELFITCVSVPSPLQNTKRMFTDVYRERRMHRFFSEKGHASACLGDRERPHPASTATPSVGAEENGNLPSHDLGRRRPTGDCRTVPRDWVPFHVLR